MVNVGKREDAMLDLIGVMKKNREATLWWLADYEKLGLLSPEVADHLRWELNKTEENELEQRDRIDAVVRSAAAPKPAISRGGSKGVPRRSNDGDTALQL